jgi:hypothetical protein
MNGFLLTIGTSDSSAQSAKCPVYYDQDQVEILQLSQNIELQTWGRQNGDIHISFKEEESLLILSGYICEVLPLGAMSNQQTACDRLRSILDKESSSQKVSELADEIHGSFSFIYISLQKNKLWTCTDRVASRQLWYCTLNNYLKISSHAVALARHSNSISFAPGPLVSYFLYGTQVDPQRSIFQGIVCQKEGTVSQAELHQPQISKTNTWYQFRHTPENNRTLNSWIEITADRFIAAAERTLETTSNPLLFLSGGVDSRLTGAALVAAGGSPLCCTLGDSPNLEVQIAIKVAKALHCTQEILYRDDEWYLREIPQAMFNANGCFTWSHSHFSVAFSQLKQKMGVDAAFLGDFGEAFSKLFISLPMVPKEAWSIRKFAQDFDLLHLPNYRPSNKIETYNLLQEDMKKTAQLDLTQAISERYESAVELVDDPLIIGDYFFRWQNVSCLPTFQMFNDVRSAGMERNLMFDKDLHQLLEIMPSDLRSTKNFGSKIVHKLCPKAAWVPNANSLLPLHFPQSAHSFAKSMRPKLGKIRRKLFSNNYKTTDSWQHFPLLYSRQPNWRLRIEETLMDKTLLPDDIFDHHAIAMCWNKFCKGDLTRHGDIERLFGFGELQRILLKD